MASDVCQSGRAIGCVTVLDTVGFKGFGIYTKGRVVCVFHETTGSQLDSRRQ